MKKDYYPTKDPYFWGMYYDPWTNLTYGNYNDHWTAENPNGFFPRIKSYQAYVANRGLAIPSDTLFAKCCLCSFEEFNNRLHFAAKMD